jgi:hypothetical protein
MGVRTTSGEKTVALFDSVTGWAFGRVFDSDLEAEDFLAFTADGPDLRTLDDDQLDTLFCQWTDHWQETHPGEEL